MRNYLFHVSITFVVGLLVLNPLQFSYAEQNTPEARETQEKQLDKPETTSQESLPSTVKSSTAIEPIPKESDNGDGAMVALVIFSLLFLLFAMFAVYRMNKMSGVRRLLHRQYANFAVDGDKVHIIKRHNTQPSHTIDISNIVSSEVFLNDISINNISNELSSAFSSRFETKLIEHFNKEKRLKMVDDKIRTIELLLTDNDGSTYPIRVYLRKGNQRLTRASFDTVINQVIDWCWLYSATINPERTEKRVVNQDVNIVKKSHNEQPAESTVVTAQVTPVKSEKEESCPPDSHEITEQELSEEIEPEVPEPTSFNTSTASEDIELISALDKLAKLKQQGLLNEQEFSEAKAKILEDLTS